MILGRNAHGVLLVLEDANSGAGSIHVLDPFRVVYWTRPDLALMNLIADWLPQNDIPHFRDDSVYQAWRREHGVHLEATDILAPRTPEGLGGKFELGNLQEEPMLDYYVTTAPLYAKAFADMRRPLPAPRKGVKGRKP